MIGMTSLVLTLLLTVAVASDSHSQKIPNILTGPGLLAGLVLSVAAPLDNIGLLNALMGVLVGFLILLPGYVLGKMGAGDVKLMAMAGSYLGPYGVLAAGLLTLIAGGLLAVLWLVMKKATQPDAPELILEGAEGVQTRKSIWKQHFPYALAIALGCLIVMYSDINVLGSSI